MWQFVIGLFALMFLCAYAGWLIRGAWDVCERMPLPSRERDRRPW